MFERFTDRARRVLVLAQEEARLLDHSFLGTEHILLGLIDESEGVAARALRELSVSAENVREKVKETIGLSEIYSTGSPPFTPRAKKVMELSLREALQLGHSYIGTEHLLLGIVREGEGVAAQVLVSLGADLPRVRQEVMDLLLPEGSQAVRSFRENPPNQRVGWQSVAGPIRAVGGPMGWRDACSFCGRDLWEVERYVSAGSGTICEDCLAQATTALRQGEADRRGEIVFPPRLFGSAPDDQAVDHVVGAFGILLQDPPAETEALKSAVEEAEELAPYLADAGRRHPVRPSASRVERIRFLDDDTAEVVFVIRLQAGPAPGFSFDGTAVRRGDRWLVTRDTVVGILRRAGLVVPPPT